MMVECQLSFEMAEGENPDAMDFYALSVACGVAEPYRSLLLSLADFDEAHGQGPELGARYEQLKAIAEACGFDEHERARWYEVAAHVPLSERQASHILDRMRREAA